VRSADHISQGLRPLMFIPVPILQREHQVKVPWRIYLSTRDGSVPHMF
jgi:hypothetical protein